MRRFRTTAVRLVVTLLSAAGWLPLAGLAAEHAGEPAAPKSAEHAPAPPAPPAAGKENAPAATAADAAEAASSPPNAMEALRERLAARLAGAPPQAGGRTNELQLVIRSGASAPAPGHKPAAGAGASKRGAHSGAPGGAQGGTHGADAGAEAHPHWAYDGPGGPQAWASLQPEFAQCASGQRQSPIDIRDGLAVDLEPVHFDYQPGHFAVQDNGHTIQVSVDAGDSIEIGGHRYGLVQFHFHRPSEERIVGRRFEMSIHLVHRDTEGHLAVVTVLVDKGAPQPVVQQVWNNLPLEPGDAQPAREMLDPVKLLPTDRSYYTYMGSLTTPPCSEGVRWIVLRTPVTLSAEQLELFARIYPMNARPLQSAAGRRILQSAQPQ